MTDDNFYARWEQFREDALANLLATGRDEHLDDPVPFTLKVVTDLDGHTRLVTEYPDR